MANDKDTQQRGPTPAAPAADARKGSKADAGAQAQLDRIKRGEQVEAGWCVDHDRRPEVYRCGDDEQAVAAGDVSLSYDRQTVTRLGDGAIVRGYDRSGMVSVGAAGAAAGGATGGDTTD